MSQRSDARRGPFIAGAAIIKLIFVCLLNLISTENVYAGAFEVGASASYRRSNIDLDAYDESKSLTGSLSYYLSEASAIELSYTDGSNTRSIYPDPNNSHVTSLTYKSVGLDLVYTFGARESAFRPYVKVGGNYILEKKIVDQYKQSGVWFETQPIEDSPSLVPSAGLGFRIGLTAALSLKVGIEGWTSRPVSQTPVTVDYAGRAGLSWFF